jgi:hypothetical protein
MLLMLNLAGCERVTVRTDFDPKTDFTRFKTYAFPTDPDVHHTDLLADPAVRQRVEQLLAHHLNSRGLQEVAPDGNPDLVVKYGAIVTDKQQTVGVGGGYGPVLSEQQRWGRGYNQPTVTEEYRIGTLIVDLLDPRTNQRAWHTSIEGTLTGDPEKTLKKVDDGLTKAFEDYAPANKK